MTGPSNARQQRGGRRFYVWGRGERYWSVTTILSALPKDALKWWAARTVADFAVERTKTWFTMKPDEAKDWLRTEPLRFTRGKANLGSALHEIIEARTLGRPTYSSILDDEDPVVRAEARSSIGHFLEWLDAMKPRFVATEASVYNRSQRYAGTLDAILELDLDVVELFGLPWDPPADGRPFVRLLVDWKTGRGVYSETALQLAAYANAEFLGLPNGQEAPLPEIDGTAVLHVRPEGCGFVPVDALDPEVFRSFLFVREVFRWLETKAKEVLGTPITFKATAPEPSPTEGAPSS